MKKEKINEDSTEIIALEQAFDKLNIETELEFISNVDNKVNEEDMEVYWMI